MANTHELTAHTEHRSAMRRTRSSVQRGTGENLKLFCSKEAAAAAVDGAREKLKLKHTGNIINFVYVVRGRKKFRLQQ
jgi:hypothetical protein